MRATSLANQGDPRAGTQRAGTSGQPEAVELDSLFALYAQKRHLTQWFVPCYTSDNQKGSVVQAVRKQKRSHVLTSLS